MFSSVFETLERRRLFSASVTNGVLTVVGTPGVDNIDINGSGSSIVSDVNNSIQTFSGVISILIQGLGGKDIITVESTIPPSMPVTVQGGAGADSITADSGAGILLGQGGADTIVAQGTQDLSQYLIVGGAGNDNLTNDNVENDIVRGGPGNDTLAAQDQFGVSGHGPFQYVLEGGAGANLITSNDDTATIISISGMDSIVGDLNGNNLIWALAAGDTIQGHLGADVTAANGSSDTIYTVGSTSNDNVGFRDFINIGATAPPNAAQLLPFANSVTDPSQL